MTRYGLPRKLIFIRLMILAMCCQVVGCGRSEPQVRPYPVQAKLMIDGKPVGPMFVMLYSTKEKGPWISGEADAQGNIRFTTRKVGDGVPAGEYKFAIPRDPLGRSSQEVPEDYRDAKSSPITVEVEAKNNELTFEIDSNYKPAVVASTDRDDIKRQKRREKEAERSKQLKSKLKSKSVEPPPLKVDPKQVQ